MPSCDAIRQRAAMYLNSDSDWSKCMIVQLNDSTFKESRRPRLSELYIIKQVCPIVFPTSSFLGHKKNWCHHHGDLPPTITVHACLLLHWSACVRVEGIRTGGARGDVHGSRGSLGGKRMRRQRGKRATRRIDAIITGICFLLSPCTRAYFCIEAPALE